MLETAYFGWTLVVWAVAFGATLLAGIVRGFTGFAFALVLISAMLLVAEPLAIVPLTLMLDLLAGIKLLPKAYHDVHWSGIRRLLVGAVVGVPVGFACLLFVEAETMKVAIYIGVLVSVILIARGIKLKSVPGTKALIGTGVVAGVTSGASGVPGPPVVLLYLSAPLPVATTRATAIAFFNFVYVFALALAIYNGLIDRDMLIRTAILIPLMIVGTTIGHHLYGVAQPETVRRAAIFLLAALAIVGIGKVLIG